MAEVKPLYSAVGAFEAQVFPMSQATNMFFRQKQFEMQRNRALENNLDEMMANTYSDRAQGRQQDIPGLEKKYNDVQEYYLRHKQDILKGGSAALDFQKLRSSFLFDVQTSKSLKDMNRALLPYAKTVVGKTELEPEQLNNITVFNLPMDDPRRQEFKFQDGRDINSITQADITPTQVFNKVEMDKTVAANVKDYKFGVETVKGDKKVREEFNMQDPAKILLGTASYLAQYPKAEKFYANQFSQLTPEQIDQATQEMTAYASMFTKNKANPVEWDENGDGKISNHIEFAVYDQIKRNLPEGLGERISFEPANLELRKDAAALARQKFAFQKQKEYQRVEEKTRNRPIDEAIADDIINGAATPQQWKEYINSVSSLYSREQEGTGNTAPGKVQYLTKEELAQKKNDPEFKKLYLDPDGTYNPNKFKDGAIIFQKQVRLTDAEGVPLIVKKGNDIGAALEQGIPASQIFQKKLANGTYELYRKTTRVVSTDKNQTPQEVRLKMKEGYSLLSEAVNDDPILKQIDNQLTKRNSSFIASPTEDVPVGGGGTNKPKSKTTTKSSSSSSGTKQ